jgi:hypothetical protein
MAAHPRPPPQTGERTYRHIEGAAGPDREGVRCGEHSKQVVADRDRRTARAAAERHELAGIAIIAETLVERRNPRERRAGCRAGR